MEKILDRIRKLLALSTSSNEHEAAQAAAKAAEMMREHDIEEAQLRIDEPEAHDASPIVDEVVDTLGRKQISWRAALANSCAQSVGAKTFTSWLAGRRVSKMYGRKSSIQHATYLFQYLTTELARIADAAYAQAETSEHGKTWKHSFLHGAVNTVTDRLLADRRAHEARMKAAEAGTALAIIRNDDLAVIDGWEKFSEKFRKSGGTRIKSGDAYRAGQSAGRQVALGGGKGLGSAQGKLRA